MGIPLHEKVLDFLEQYRSQHPDFVYWLRERNNSNRLEQGCWFQGREDYAFVGLYNRGGGSNMTRSFGLVFWWNGEEIGSHVEIVYNEEKDERIIAFYQKAMEKIGEFKKEHERKFSYYLADTGFEAARNFLDNTKPEIDALAREMGLDLLFIDQKDFEKKLNRVSDIRKKLPSAINYWIFQGNPDMFDLATAIKEELLQHWTVKAHIDKIKVGDKVILWMTGSQAGCYALAEITSPAGEASDLPDSRLWKTEEKQSLKAGIKITHSLIESPLLWKNLRDVKGLENLKVGNQGTNFSATKEEYETIYSLIKSPKINTHMVEKLPSNLILFGPPGTGKTYISKSLAVQIAENLSEAQLNSTYPTRDDINDAFKRLQKAQQIGFVTFHQSFSYEDFIEGIKPKMVNEDVAESTGESGQKDYLTYEIQDGIFKVMAERADSYQTFISESNDLAFDKQTVSNLENKQFYKMSLGNTANENEQVIYDYCLENNCIALGWGQAIDYRGVKEEKNIAKLLEDNGGAESSYEVFAVKCFILWMQIGDIVFISDGNHKARAIGIIDGEYFYDEKSPVYYRHFRKVKWLAKNVNIPVDKIYGKQFSQQTIYQMWPHLVKKEFFTEKLSKETTPLNHVLIIDEINRGNIASIFGELITLIEEDKRKGGKEYFPATLPYSKKPFSVPSNLYIIGTMNTADRSVEALDTALRRRFDFREMPPKPDLLKGSLPDIDLEALLSTINARIEKLMDKDHKIGHAYFMGIATSKEPLQELKRVFQHRILPLMQEYFYGDIGKMALVIGGAFFEQDKNDVKFMTVGWYDAAELPERRVDKLKNVMDMEGEEFTDLVKATYQKHEAQNHTSL